MSMSSWALIRNKELWSSSAQINVSTLLRITTLTIYSSIYLDVSAVMSVNDYTEIGKFFGGFLKPQS